MALALVGCGGNNASQPSNVSATLTLSSVISYPNDATPVETLSSGAVVRPLALFASSKSSEELLVWGSRDATTGDVTGVHESAITSTDASSKLGVSPLYARYDTDGSLISLKDTTTSSSLTFSARTTFTDSKGNVYPAIRFAGVDDRGKTASGTAYLQTNGGVTVSLDSTTNQAQTVSAAEIKAILAHARATAADPLMGLTTVDTEPSDRLQILTAVFKVAAVVVDKDFKSTIVDTEGFVLLSGLGTSYTAYLNNGGTVPIETPTATLPAYRTDLPTP